MVKTKKTRTRSNLKRNKPVEADSTYILKLVMYLIIGSFWVKITYSDDTQLPIPVGLIVGLFFASHDHFKIDRKVEYALLLVAAIIGFWLPIGLFIAF